MLEEVEPTNGYKGKVTIEVGSDGTTYEIEVTVISNPTTNSVLYIGIGLILILILGTSAYITYRIKNVVNKE